MRLARPKGSPHLSQRLEPGIDGLARTNLRFSREVVRKRGWCRLGTRKPRRCPWPPHGRIGSYLKLSLVSCPIALYTGTSSTERVSFRQINKKTGNRLRQQLVDEVTREPVEGPDKGRG